jgi:hypothetical protein
LRSVGILKLINEKVPVIFGNLGCHNVPLWSRQEIVGFPEKLVRSKNVSVSLLSLKLLMAFPNKIGDSFAQWLIGVRRLAFCPTHNIAHSKPAVIDLVEDIFD